MILPKQIIDNFKVWRRNQDLKHAISLAQKLSQSDNKTRYVIEGQKGFHVLSTTQVNDLKKRHIFKPGFTIADLYEKSVFVVNGKKITKKVTPTLGP